MKGIIAVLATGLTITGLAAQAMAQDRPHEGVDLRVLTTQQTWDQEIADRVSAFEEETGASVQIDMFAFAQAVQRGALELSTGSPAYDIVFLESADVARFAPNGFLEPLDAYLASADDFDLADIIPATLAANQHDGVQYGIPHFAATQIMYFRGDLLEEAGYDGPPDTWADFITLCAELHTDERSCTAMRGKPSASENIWYWTQIFYGYGGEWVADFPIDMTPTVNSEAAVEALEVYQTLLTEYAVPGAASAGFDEVVVAMQQGNIFLAVEGAPLAGRILDPELSRVSGVLGFAVPPGGPAGTRAPFDSQAWAVNAASENKDAAADLLMWATSRETVLDVALNSSFLAVTRTSVWNDPAFQERHGYDFGYGAFTDAYAGTLATAAPQYILPFEGFRAMADRVGLAIQEAAVGRKSAEEALDDAQADIEQMFRRSGVIE